MPGFSSLTNIWNNLKEIDLRPIREEAEQPINLILVGEPGSGVVALAKGMHRDPHRPDLETYAPLPVVSLEHVDRAASADLVILVVDSRVEDLSREKETARRLVEMARSLIVFVNQENPAGPGSSGASWVNWGQKRVVYGPVDDPNFLMDKFATAVMALLPNRLLALGRSYPLFRLPVAQWLIKDACFSNAAYALSTGLGEMIPVFDIPLNVADMFVLSKAQAFLAYKLGLAVGYSTRWQDYVAEFGSVLGGGFVWRQIARGLIGLVPAWGIIPKVAVSYAGTYVVGQVILQWYLTGRHVTKEQMRALYGQAFGAGKVFGQSLVNKLPRPRWKLPRIGQKTQAPKLLQLPDERRACPACGRLNAADASFCQYCGQPVQPESERH